MKIFVESEGSISGKVRGEIVALYSKPGGENNVFKKVKITESVKNYLDLLESFDRSKTPRYTDLITSHEKEGDFFKVCYKGEYAWLKKGGVVVLYTLEEYLKKIGSNWSFSESENKPSFYEEPFGTKLTYQDLMTRAPRVSVNSVVYVKFQEYKILQGRLWVRVLFDKSIYEYVKRGDEFKEKFKPFSVWFNPYKEDGSVNGWEYPYKDVKFYKRN